MPQTKEYRDQAGNLRTIKWCGKCQQQAPQRDKPRGCLFCHNARAKAWRAANKEKQLEYSRKHHNLHRDRIREKNQAKQHRRRAAKFGVAAEVYTAKQVAQRDLWICQLCRGPIDSAVKHPDPGSLAIDHILALIKGGADNLTNVWATHKFCNQRKWANDVVRFEYIHSPYQPKRAGKRPGKL